MTAPLPDETPAAPQEATAEPVVTITRFGSNKSTTGKRFKGRWSTLFESFSRAGVPARTAEEDKSLLPGWSAATFRENHRALVDVEQVAALVLDYDDGRTSLHDAVAAWDVTAYAVTSWRHTSEHPKFRVIVPYTAPVTRAQHDVIWDWAQAKLEAMGHIIDRQCKDASRFWYLPSKRTEEFTCLQNTSRSYLDVDALLATIWVDSDDVTLDEDEARRVEGDGAWRTVPLAKRVALAGTAIKNWKEAVSGEEGSKACISLAGVLVVGYALPEDTAVDLLESDYSPRCEPPWSRRELEHKVKDAAKNPLGLAMGYKIKPKKEDPPDNVVQLSEVRNAQTKKFQHTDHGNAELLVSLHGANIRYQVAAKQWLVWDGRRWAPDISLEMERLAIQTIRHLYVTVTGLTKDEIKAQRAWAKKSESDRGLRAMIAQARALCVVDPETLDQHPWKLVVLNGTLDLRTGKLGPHCREDLITQIAPIEYDPEADTSIADKFLCSVQPDMRMRGYLWRRFGYALTGDTEQQLFWIDYGSGANGKSTIINAIHRLMGDYAGVLPATAIQQHRGEFHPTEQMLLKARRFVSASEPDKGAKLNVGFIKTFTGDNVITARKMGQDHQTYRSYAKASLACNSKPPIPETDEGTWRRIHLVDWPVRLRKSKDETGDAPVIDPSLPERLATEGAPGLLKRMVEGLRDYQRLGGFGAPPSVLAATQSYRSEEDRLADFVEDMLVITKSADDRVSTSELHQAYLSWCEAEGTSPKFRMSKKSLTMALNERRIGEVIRTSEFRGRSKLRLAAPAAQPDHEWTDENV